jgi:adenosine kinase
VFSAWGEDLDAKGYKAALLNQGHELKGRVGEFTAHCYNVSDPLHQQLVIWQPNHYEANKDQSLTEFYQLAELEQFTHAIFSAGTPDSILKHMSEFRAVNTEAVTIFDPGQISPFFTAEQFKTCVDLASIVIGNKVEAEHFEAYMNNFWPEHVTQITTFGADGVRYRAGRMGESTHVPAVVAETVLETTGAGDAFRAGLIHALSQSLPLEEALALGAQLGADSVQLPSPQPQ